MVGYAGRTVFDDTDPLLDEGRDGTGFSALAGAELESPVSGSGASAGTYLAKLRAEVPHSDRPRSDASEDICPRHATIEEFRELHHGNEKVQTRLRNTVKVCAQCGKACAHTLNACNSCGASLAGVPCTYTDNVFMGFVYGIGKGRFPYKISVRKQTTDLLCFDDPLSMAVVHLNAIPTDVYIPDCRYLFTDPTRGLALVDKLLGAAATVAMEQYWSLPSFREKFFAGESVPSPTEIASIALCGMNYPPSMYQLHLQFIHPPLLPFHFSQTLRNEHFHHGRFLPFEYLREALALGERARMTVKEDTTLQDIMCRLKELGVDYDAAHSSMMKRCQLLQKRFSPWRVDDFAYQVMDGNVFQARRPDEASSPASEVARREEDASLLEAMPDESAAVIQKADTEALQNYGRPYVNGKPSGTYYMFPKDPSEVASFGEALEALGLSDAGRDRPSMCGGCTSMRALLWQCLGRVR